MGILKSLFKQRILGIDIGTDAVKIVEISNWLGQNKLENYAEIKSSLISKGPLLEINESGQSVASDQISKALKEMLKEGKFGTKRAVFSLPDFLTFAAFFEIPPMPEKEIDGAVYYNASRYLTLPVSEVTLDWKMIPASGDKNSTIKVFLIAVPNQVIEEYRKIAKDAGLDLIALDPEVFGISRALIGKNKESVALIDIGAKTSVINILDKGYLKRSYSVNFGSNQLTTALSNYLGISLDEAEKLKIEEGLLSKKEIASKTIKNLIDQFFSETKGILNDYSQKHGQISQFYLSGGIVNVPGFKNYFSDSFKSPVQIPNCFTGVNHPNILQGRLLQMAPRFSASVGVALGILQM